jgi:hypothetical protein
MQLRRLGSQRILEDLEKQEPDLMEFLLEEYSAIHQSLSKLGTPPKPLRRVTGRIEAMALVLVMSLRHSPLRLWQQEQEPGELLPNESTGENPYPTSQPPTSED